MASLSRDCAGAGIAERLITCGFYNFVRYCVDDRNTDNAWLETVVTGFHDNECGVGSVVLSPSLHWSDQQPIAGWLSRLLFPFLPAAALFAMGSLYSQGKWFGT